MKKLSDMLEEALSQMIDDDLEKDEVRKCCRAFMDGDAKAMNTLANQLNKTTDGSTVDVGIVACCHALASIIASVTQAEPDKGATMMQAAFTIADDMRKETYKLNREKKDA